MRQRLKATLFLIFISACSTQPQPVYFYEDVCQRPQWKSEGYKYVTNSISSCLNGEHIELDGLKYKCDEYIPNIPNSVLLISQNDPLTYNSNQLNDCQFYGADLITERTCKSSNQNPNYRYTSQSFRLIEHEWQIKMFQIVLPDQSAYSVSLEQDQFDSSSRTSFIGCHWESVDNGFRVYYKLPTPLG